MMDKAAINARALGQLAKSFLTRPATRAVAKPLALGAGAYGTAKYLQGEMPGASFVGEQFLPAASGVFAATMPRHLMKTTGQRWRSLLYPTVVPLAGGKVQRVMHGLGMAGADPQKLIEGFADLSVNPQEKLQRMAQQTAQRVISEQVIPAAKATAREAVSEIKPILQQTGRELVGKLGTGATAGIGTYLLMNALLKGVIPPAELSEAMKDGVLTPQEIDEYYRTRNRRQAIRQALSGLAGTGAGAAAMTYLYPWLSAKYGK